MLVEQAHDHNLIPVVAGVRKNALMVLTHLILNDMMKVKGHIARLATCLQDPQPRIASLAHLFFEELSHKVTKVRCFVTCTWVAVVRHRGTVESYQDMLPSPMLVPRSCHIIEPAISRSQVSTSKIMDISTSAGG